jgi:hypothetical protein
MSFNTEVVLIENLCHCETALKRFLVTRTWRNLMEPNRKVRWKFQHRCFLLITTIITPWPYSASELYRPSDRRLCQLADRGCRVVSAADPYDSNLGILDWSRYYFFPASPQLHSRVLDPVPDPLLLRKSGSAGNQIRTSGSVAGNSDH